MSECRTCGGEAGRGMFCSLGCLMEDREGVKYLIQILDDVNSDAEPGGGV